jgi:hypothetical protein
VILRVEEPVLDAHGIFHEVHQRRALKPAPQGPIPQGPAQKVPPMQIGWRASLSPSVSFE